MGAERRVFMQTYSVTTLTVSLDAIENNFRIARSFCAPEVRQIAVVKDDAYGHNAVAVSRRLLGAGAWGLAVACADEGIELREAGVAAPILVLGGAMDACIAEAETAYDLAQAVGDAQTLQLMENAARRAGKRALAHMKLDTGMSRIGARTDAEIDALLDKWRHCPRVEMQGIFSHLANADGDIEFTARQRERFIAACGRALSSGFRPIRHLSASTGVALGRDYHFDAVRPGVVLYGASVNGLFPGVVPAQTLKTRPVRFEWIEAGEPVGYGCAWRAKRRTRIMTLPVGYGDGYPRALGGRADVLIGGKRAPLVGRVCMDQMMADATDIPEEALGGEAVLLGAQGDERITPDELAALSGTIPYEIMLGFGKRFVREVK